MPLESIIDSQNPAQTQQQAQPTIEIEMRHVSNQNSDSGFASGSEVTENV